LYGEEGTDKCEHFCSGLEWSRVNMFRGEREEKIAIHGRKVKKKEYAAENPLKVEVYMAINNVHGAV
jgi:hypothetical protein